MKTHTKNSLTKMSIRHFTNVHIGFLISPTPCSTSLQLVPSQAIPFSINETNIYQVTQAKKKKKRSSLIPSSLSSHVFKSMSKSYCHRLKKCPFLSTSNTNFLIWTTIISWLQESTNWSFCFQSCPSNSSSTWQPEQILKCKAVVMTLVINCTYNQAQLPLHGL